MENKDPIYARLAGVGESDSGKTFSSSILAQELAPLDKWVLVDTEFRGKLYRSKFPFKEIITLEPPFETEKLIEIIESCKHDGTAGLMVDSATQFWERIVEISDEMKNTVKDGRRIWAKLTPKWDAFKLAINSAPFHVITTWKVKDTMPVNAGDKPQKRVVTRGGGKGLKFDYHLVFSFNEKREAVVVKDNYDLFRDWKEPKMIDAEVGKKIAKWLMDN